MTVTEEARQEDLALGDDTNRICLPLMNKFDDDRLPTLDTKLWLEKGMIRFTYFEKSIKTPFLLMKRSAMSQHQRCAILANELVR